MARSHREVFSFVAAVIVLYIGVVVSTNCNSSDVSPVVPFCSDLSVSGRTVYLSGLDNGTNGAGCNCFFRLTSSNQDSVKIGIKNATTASSLCDYLLYSVFKHNSTILYSCRQNVHHESFDLKLTETVRLHMESGTYNGVGFPFCLQLLVDPGSQMILKCTTQSAPTPLTSMKTSSTHNSTSTISDNKHVSTSSTIAALSTSQNSRSGGSDGTSYTTDTSNISSGIRPTTEPQPNNDDPDRLIGIITGFILAVLIVVAIVIIVVCLVKRRKTKPPYETPLKLQDSPHSYVNAAITPNSNANDHNNQITKSGNPGMICFENDLYKSFDEDVPVGTKGSNHEGMIYLENDLYISSDETDNVHHDADNSVPHQPVEYAVVNKTAKKSSSGNGALTGHTVGPHGDEYTLVQKK